MTQQKRLFVGGLYHGIVEQELKERFTKFGTVGGIDIKTRSDDNGTPIKTFAYVDIDIGEKELKQCVQTYNKTKWKGHELQLQIAKPSFLDKLKQEREQAGEEAKSEEVLSSACATKDIQERVPVKDFHMKGAVPGTAVDEQKNWVVGKYGRVLPVMKIRKKKKIMKVDPSKYCHFVKKLEKDNNKHPKSAAEEVDAAIDDLTWQLEEKQYKDPNRIFSKGSALKAAKKKSTHTASFSNKQTKLGKRTAAYSSSDSSDDDEEEEEDEPQKLHVMHNQRKLNNSQNQEISFEIVSPNTLKSPSLLIGGMPSMTESAVKRRADTYKASVDSNSDSPDTDDILSLTGSVQRLGVGKTESTVTHNDDKSEARLKRKKLTDRQKRTKKRKALVVSNKEGEENGGTSSAHTDKLLTQRSDERVQRNLDTSETSDHHPTVMLHSEFADRVDTERRYGDGSSSSDEDLFDKMASNKFRQYIKSARDKSLVHVKPKNAVLQDSSRTRTDSVNRPSASVEYVGTGKSIVSNIDTSETAANSVSDTSSDSETEMETEEQLQSGDSEESASDSSGDIMETSQTVVDKKEKSTENSGSMTSVNERTKEKGLPLCGVQESDSENSSEEATSDSDDSSSDNHSPSHNQGLKTTDNRSMKTITGDSKTTGEASLSSVGKEKVDSVGGPDVIDSSKKKMTQKLSKKPSKVELHQAANEKRLASVKQKQQQVMSQQMLIQKALSSVDSKPSKKVVFDSDSDSDQEPEKLGEEPKQQETKQTNNLALFSSSDDSEASEDGCEERDQDRFRVRPEYEGRAGKKLMSLQSKIGNDKRFKMAANFLESESEAEESEGEKPDSEDKAALEDSLHEEKTKSLAILKSVVGSKAFSKEKKKAVFKDISALQYDPTREDHKQFEVKQFEVKQFEVKQFEVKPKEEDTLEKQSKRKKRKAEEESVKPEPEVPEVSTERFFEVSSELTQAFKAKTDEKESSEKPFSLSAMFGSRPEVTEGHTDMEVESDPVKAAPVSEANLWEDLLKGDSGNDDEESDDDDKESPQSKDAEAENAETPVVKQRETFFFQDQDPRVMELASTFCRTDDPETLRAKWLDHRPACLQACKKNRRKALSRSTGDKEKKMKFLNTFGPVM